MRRSAATLLCAVWGAAWAAGSAAYGDEKLACGIYALRGRLGSSAEGRDFVELWPGTTNQVTVGLVGLSTERSLSYHGRVVEITAAVTDSPKFSRSQKAKVTAFKGSVTLQSAIDEPYRLIEKKSCQESP